MLRLVSDDVGLKATTGRWRCLGQSGRRRGCSLLWVSVICCAPAGGMQASCAGSAGWGAAAGVTVLVPLVFHHHFCHDSSVTVQDVSPQPGGRRETQCMFLT